MKTPPPLVCAATMLLLTPFTHAVSVVFDDSINDVLRNSIDATDYANSGGNTIDFSCFTITATTNIDAGSMNANASVLNPGIINGGTEIGILEYNQNAPMGGSGLAAQSGKLTNYDGINDIYVGPLTGSNGISDQGNIFEQITFDFLCEVDLSSVSLDLRDFDHNNGGDASADGIRLWVFYDNGSQALFNADGLLGSDVNPDKLSYDVNFSKFVGATALSDTGTGITADSTVDSFILRATGDQVWINGLDFDVVPEPNTFALGAVGLLMILRRRHRY